jgi:hypothetical protein
MRERKQETEMKHQYGHKNTMTKLAKTQKKENNVYET